MTRRLRWTLASLLALLTAAGPGACKGSAQCLRHTDCTREEMCDLGTCVMKPTAGSGLGDAGSGNEPGTTGGSASTTGGRSATGGTRSSGGEAGNGGAGGDGGDGGAGG